MLDGKYEFRSTVKEANTNEKYPFRMNLNIENNHITGDIDYFNDNCSGTISGKALSETKLKLFEKIKEGSDICSNGVYLYDLKYQIISKANSYTLENIKHSVTINSYKFTPKPHTWDNIALKKYITHTKIDIEQLDNQIIKYREQIVKVDDNKSKSQLYLDNNTTFSIDGQCTKPPLAPKPTPLFDTQEKANNYALAYCSISFGCRVGVELAGDRLDTTTKRFLASQSCTLLVRDYVNRNTLVNETMFNLLDSVSYDTCNDETDDIFSAILKGGSCIMSGAVKLERINQYINCIEYKTEEFHNTYLDWKNEPEKKKMECDNNLKIVNETPKLIKREEEKIQKIQYEITIENIQLRQLKNVLTKVLLLRKKQSELIKQLKN